jgi:hypothetical protein
MVLAVPAGAHTVDLLFRRTVDRTIGDAISILSVLAFIAFTLLKRPLTRP